MIRKLLVALSLVFAVNLIAHAGDREEALKLYEAGKYQQGFTLLEKAAKAGDAKAQENLAEIYMRGIGIPKDPAREFYWFMKAAEQGLPLSQYNIGVSYEHGMGVKKDRATATGWFKKAAEQGYADAQGKLAYYYETGQGGLPLDKKKAFTWMRKAADQGQSTAQYSLGIYYNFGTGTPVDGEKARYWYEKAIYNDGHLGAANNLAIMMIVGEVVPQNTETGIKLLNAAADQGYPTSQYMMGYAFETGQFVEKSLDKALHYYRLAAAQGEERAINRLEELEKAGFK